MRLTRWTRRALYTRAQDYVVRLTQVEMAFAHSNALTRKRETAAPFFSLLEEELPEKADGIDYFLRGCELCAQAAEVNPAQVLTFARAAGTSCARVCRLKRRNPCSVRCWAAGSVCFLPSRRSTAGW